MRLPEVIPGDPPVHSVKTVLLELPDWVYWQLVGTAETEQEDVGYLFVLASRAIIADFDAVEALALRKFVQKRINEGLSDPAIAKLLDIPLRRVRDIRKTCGIETRVKGRGLKKPA